MTAEPSEDRARLARTERVILVEVIGSPDEVPANLLATVLQIRAQSLRGREGRVAIADQEVGGQVRGAGFVVGRLAATVNHDSGEVGRPGRRVHADVRRAA